MSIRGTFTSIKRICVVALAVCLLFPIGAMADIAEIDLSGTTDLGNFVSATVTLNWDGTDLIAKVKNTSSDSSVITGFGLMGGTASLLASDFSASGTLDDPVWFAGNSLSLSPPKTFGTFDFGGDTPPVGLNAGDPNAGVEAGRPAATFTFSNLNSGYQSALNFLYDSNENDLSVAVRFQRVGPNGQDSWKLGGFGGELLPPPIPAPGAVLLGLIGLSIVGRVKRRFV